MIDQQSAGFALLLSLDTRNLGSKGRHTWTLLRKIPTESMIYRMKIGWEIAEFRKFRRATYIGIFPRCLSPSAAVCFDANSSFICFLFRHPFQRIANALEVCPNQGNVLIDSYFEIKRNSSRFTPPLGDLMNTSLPKSS